MANRLGADTGGGFRGVTADFGASASESQRAGFGSEQNPSAKPGQEVLSSNLPGNPHSSRGFKRAIMKVQRKGSSLKDQLPSKKNFSGPGYRKPNYFAQGGGRHGMHIDDSASQDKYGGYG